MNTLQQVKALFVIRDYYNQSGICKTYADWVDAKAEVEGRDKVLPPSVEDDIDVFALAPIDFVCGVEYISQLHDWFFHFLPEFLAEGFKVYLYTIPKSKILFGTSGKQVAFRKADAIETEVIYEC